MARCSIKLPRGCSLQLSLSVAPFMGGGGGEKKNAGELISFHAVIVSTAERRQPTDKSNMCCSEVSGEVLPCSARQLWQTPTPCL